MNAADSGQDPLERLEGSASRAAITAAASQTRAFELADNTRDAVILITLQPGAYTAVVSGVGSATGIGLVEVYTLD